MRLVNAERSGSFCFRIPARESHASGWLCFVLSLTAESHAVSHPLVHSHDHSPQWRHTLPN
jgi:hypothetical protein